MSHNVRLLDPVSREPLHTEAPHRMIGGTYTLGGTTELWLNVTYNYYSVLSRPDILGEKGIEHIYGLSGAESLPLLKRAASNLGDDVDEDYWQPTEGNVKRALMNLIAMASLRPDGIWDGD